MDEPIETWTVAVTADVSELQLQLDAAGGYARQFSRAVTSAFTGVAVQGKSLGDVFKSLALSMSKIALQAAFRPLEQSIGGLFSSLLAGGLGGSVTPFAKGGVLGSATPLPFASGGVIASPIAFPLRGGAIGLAGERGAEAIMPLARDPDGRLGVKAQGGGGPVAITFNITTPDADSFRRTETQISAMLARAVGQGQRNL
ncbi:MAG: phage tail tape measure protein [Hyphomicrobiaceae bacterium]